MVEPCWARVRGPVPFQNPDLGRELGFVPVKLPGGTH
jgi:hypothetical protein